MSLARTLANTILNSGALGVETPQVNGTDETLLSAPELTRRQQKKHAALLRALAERWQDGVKLVPMEELANTAKEEKEETEGKRKPFLSKLFARNLQEALRETESTPQQEHAGQQSPSAEKYVSQNPLQDQYATSDQQAAELVTQMEKGRATMSVDPPHLSIGAEIARVESTGNLVEMRQTLAIIKCFQNIPGFIGCEDVNPEKLGHMSPTPLSGKAGDRAAEFRTAKQAEALNALA